MKDWKLKLRYGKISTPYKHFTVLGNCNVGELQENFSCRPGPAYVAIKIWATDTQEAANIFFDLGEQIGFIPFKDVEVYDTEAVQPPRENPYAYDISFSPYDENAE